MSIDRSARRRLTRLTHENEITIAADARFFERRPDRSHRIRLASRAEVETLYLMHPNRERVADLRWYTVIRQLTRGMRFRVFVLGLPDLDCDVAEDVCRAVYEREQTHQAREIEGAYQASMRRAQA